MIQTIRLHQLLCETVSSPYRYLVTRPTGAAIRGRIESALEQSLCITALIDFAQVELIDFSCADEVVAKLLVGRTTDGPYFVLRGLRQDQVEAVDHVLNHRSLAIATVTDTPEPPRILGCADADTRRAFDCVCEDGPVDEGTLAGRLGWARERAAAALGALASLRLARMVGDACHPLPFL